MSAPPPARVRRPPWRAWGLLASGVAAVHLALLMTTAPPPRLPAPRPVVQLLPPARIDAAPAARPTTAPASVGRAAAAPPPPPARPPGRPPARTPADTPPPETRAVAAALPAAPASTAAPPPPADGAPPYPVRLPPPATLRYAVARGEVAGSAVLSWQPDAGGYALTLVADGPAGAPAFELASRGQLDAAGLAPERFTDRRRRGGVLAANFQRERGVVTFSGPSLEWPLADGMQDRASWLLQLAAIVAADPARAAPGATTRLAVVGARGDADLWTFTAGAPEDLALPAGPVPGARPLVREPQRRHDQRVEVWLDPARGHLPVRLRLAPAGADANAATELLLTGTTP